MIGSAAAVGACARAVIWPTHPRRTVKGSRAGCTGGWERHSGWRSGAAERVNRTRPPAGVVESVIYARSGASASLIDGVTGTFL
jgi:hypothetical protein